VAAVLHGHGATAERTWGRDSTEKKGGREEEKRRGGRGPTGRPRLELAGVRAIRSLAERGGGTQVAAREEVVASIHLGSSEMLWAARSPVTTGVRAEEPGRQARGHDEFFSSEPKKTRFKSQPSIFGFTQN
jgi:hypothetical protein